LSKLETVASSPAPCLTIVVFNCTRLHLVVRFDTRARFILLDGVAMTRAVGVFLGREVWQGSRGATDIITDFQIIAEVSLRVILREFILRYVTTSGKTVTPFIGIDFNVFASTSDSTRNEGTQHQSSKEGHDVQMTLEIYTEGA